MHQSHNIPWHILTPHLKVKKVKCLRCRQTTLDWNHCTTVLLDLDDARQRSDRTHFAKCLVKTVKTFAETERQKYPPNMHLIGLDPESGVISTQFVEDYIARYSPTNPAIQYSNIKEVLANATTPIKSWLLPGDEDNRVIWEFKSVFLGIPKVLIDADEVSTLLTLAKRPDFHVKSYFYYGQPYAMGWGHVAELALQCYVFLNMVASMPQLMESKSYAKTRQFHSILKQMESWWDYSQVIPHMEFWMVKNKGREAANWLYQAQLAPCSQLPECPLDIFGNVEELQMYLKKCFRLMYLVEMLAQECGWTIPWDNWLAVSIGEHDYHVE